MIYIVLLLALLALELLYFRVADKCNIIDKPNERSSHTSITLRGGGIIFYFGALLYFFTLGWNYPYFMLGLTLISVISFIDDVHSSSRIVRLGVHLTAMLLLFQQWALYTEYPWWYLVVALIICTGIINAYNFMDGINGITGGYSLVCMGSLLYINRAITPFIEESFLLVIILSLLVFNFFNFRKKARCFAGDVGSVTIAFIILFALGQLILQTDNISFIILLAVYGVDSVLTIVHRLMLKENIFDAHRKHAYQLLANELGWSHLCVSALYMLMQLLVTVGYFTIGKDSPYFYLMGVLAILGISYVLFMKKYFSLHQV